MFVVLKKGVTAHPRRREQTACIRRSPTPSSKCTLRWKTLASLMSYVKTKPSAFADMIQLGTSIDAGTAIHDDTPVHEPDEVKP